MNRQNPNSRAGQILVNEKRFGRRLKQLQKESASVDTTTVIRTPRAPSPTLRYLNTNDRFSCVQNVASWKGSNVTIRIPSQFSFISEPDKALNVIKSLAEVYSHQAVARINLDHRKCEALDLGASVVMDVIALELQQSFQIAHKQVAFSGKYPDNISVKEILLTSGIIKHLGVRDQMLNPPNVKCLPLILGAKDTRPSRTSPLERALRKLAEYLNECLKTQGLILTNRGNRDICGMAGEILTNAEEHSSLNRWYVIGHMTQEGNSGPGCCNLAIFNFGRSIFETLEQPNTPAHLTDRMQGLSDRHNNKGFFSQQWTKETLWTLFALQEGVSRFTKEGEANRGLGTVKMIEFFLRLGRPSTNGQEGPQMALVSGSTHILFDGKYELKPKYIRGDERQVIAFNHANDLHLPPDRKYVRALKGFFPGTLITMRFYLDGSYLHNAAQH